MRAFRIGYILSLSFLLILTVVTLTFGFYQPPSGPKAPEYPDSSSSLYDSSGDLSDDVYQRRLDERDKQLDEYDAKQKIYEEQQKTFVKDKVVPYARNVFAFWVVMAVGFQVIGLLLSKFRSPLVGAAFSFSGVWAVILGPLGGLLWFVNSLVSSFATQAEQEFTTESIFQTIGLISLLGVALLTTLGLFFYGEFVKKLRGAILTEEVLPTTNSASEPVPPTP
ncbi:MAG TPA: hypothetical protein VIH52_01580 [Candidatus Nanoarchaeia archaeon]